MSSQLPSFKTKYFLITALRQDLDIDNLHYSRHTLILIESEGSLLQSLRETSIHSSIDRGTGNPTKVST